MKYYKIIVILLTLAIILSIVGTLVTGKYLALLVVAPSIVAIAMSMEANNLRVKLEGIRP